MQIKPIIALATFYLSLILIIIWYAYSLIDQHESNQLRVLEFRSETVGRFIENFIRDRTYAIREFATVNVNDMIKLANADVSDEELEAFEEKLRAAFPKHFSYIVRNEDGEFYPDLFKEQVGDMCRSGINEYMNNRKELAHLMWDPESLHKITFLPIIHPHVDDFHFDVVTDWIHEETGQIGAFMVSYHPSLLIEILNTYKDEHHQVMLLNRQVPGLIEVMQSGSRDVLQREFHLTEDEMKRLYAMQPVYRTGWDIAYLVDESIFVNYRNVVWKITAIIIALLTFLTIYVYWKTRGASSD